MPELDGRDDDWASQISAKLDLLVGLIRDRSVRPAFGAVRVLVLAVIGLVIGLAVLVMVVISLFRLFDTAVFAGRSWITDFVFGGMLIVLSTFLFRAGARTRSRDV